MKNSKNILLIFLLLNLTSSDCNERYTAYAYRFIDWLSSFESLNKLSNSSRNNREVKDKYQFEQFFIDAQKELGMKDNEILPVLCITSDEFIKKYEKDKVEAFAYTTNNEITVIKENFESLSYGAKRLIAFHETYHHKFHDDTFKRWLEGDSYKKSFDYLPILFCPTACYLCTQFHLLNNINKDSFINYNFVDHVFHHDSILKHKHEIKSNESNEFFWKESLILITGGLLATYITFERLLPKIIFDYYDFESYKDFRADRETVKIAKCSKCIEEYQAMELWNKKNYMNHDELQKYIDLYKDKLCIYHKSFLS